MTSEARDDWFTSVTGKSDAVEHAVFILIQICITNEQQRSSFVNLLQRTVEQTKNSAPDYVGLKQYERTMNSYIEVARNLDLGSGIGK